VVAPRAFEQSAVAKWIVRRKGGWRRGRLDVALEEAKSIIPGWSKLVDTMVTP
jgi:hypothetical protein